MRAREALIYGITTGLAAALLICLALIAITGVALVWESNIWILAGEITLLAAIIGFTMVVMISRHRELKSENCRQLDTCHKIQMVLDKDFHDTYKVTLIRRICARCPEEIR